MTFAGAPSGTAVRRTGALVAKLGLLAPRGIRTRLPVAPVVPNGRAPATAPQTPTAAAVHTAIEQAIAHLATRQVLGRLRPSLQRNALIPVRASAPAVERRRRLVIGLARWVP